MAALRYRGRFRAEFIERALQLGRDIRCLAVFDVAALHHVDQLAIAQQCNRG